MTRSEYGGGTGARLISLACGFCWSMLVFWAVYPGLALSSPPFLVFALLVPFLLDWGPRSFFRSVLLASLLALVGGTVYALSPTGWDGVGLASLVLAVVAGLRLGGGPRPLPPPVVQGWRWPVALGLAFAPALLVNRAMSVDDPASRVGRHAFATAVVVAATGYVVFILTRGKHRPATEAGR